MSSAQIFDRLIERLQQSDLQPTISNLLGEALDEEFIREMTNLQEGILRHELVTAGLIGFDTNVRWYMDEQLRREEFIANDFIEAINSVELLDDTWSSSWGQVDRQRGRQRIIAPWIPAERTTPSIHGNPVRHQRGLQAALQRERERQRRARSRRPTGVRRILRPRS